MENLRTRGGSRRRVKRVVGWHYRNMMSVDDVLRKYQTYSHATEGSPLHQRFNITDAPLNVTHVLMERREDCRERKELIKEVALSMSDLPLILRDAALSTSMDGYFINKTEFYDLLTDDS